MNKNELGSILSLLSVYPGFKVTDTQASAWWVMLKDEEYAPLARAAREYGRTNTRLPTPAGLLSTATKLKEARMSELIEKARERDAQPVPGFDRAPDDGTSCYARWLTAMAAGNYGQAQAVLDEEEAEDHRGRYTAGTIPERTWTA